jgi:hypothetical protein
VAETLMGHGFIGDGRDARLWRKEDSSR